MSNPAYQELVQVVETHPFNVEKRLELADYLASQNNPRARLIKEQCAAKPDAELVQKLLAEHGRHWTAQDLGIH